MPCSKTGCHVYIEPHNAYAYGDAFELADVAYFRLVAMSYEGTVNNSSVVHYTIRDWDSWFDTAMMQSNQASTLITTEFINHGYDGVPINGQ